MIKGAIFDVDGTLLDSMHIWGELGERYLTSIGKKAEEGLAQILLSMTLAESSAYVKKTYGIPDTVDQIKEDALKLLENIYQNETEPKPGVIAYLTFLRSKNVPMALATAGDRKILIAALKRLKIADLFDVILTCAELNTNKRDSLIYRRAAETLGSRPEETVVFEDVLYGIQTAKDAGFITVGVEEAASEKDREAIRTIADYYICDFNDPILRTL